MTTPPSPKLQTSESVHSFSTVKFPIQSEPWKKLTPLPSCYKTLSTAAVPQGIFSTASACLFSAPLRHGFCTTSEAHYCFYFALLHAKNSIGLQHLRCQIEEDILVTNNKKKKKSPSYGNRFDWRERQPEDGDGVQWLAFLS